MAAEEHIDLGRCFNLTLDAGATEPEACKQTVLAAVQKAGFILKDSTEKDAKVSFQAIWGKKCKAFLTHLLPLGYHLPTGKRFLLSVTLSVQDSLQVQLRIDPYMDWLMDETEIPGVTQSSDERVSDEYLAAHLMQGILLEIKEPLGLTLPEYYQNFDSENLMDELIEGVLAYALEGQNYPRILHRTDEPGPSWTWGAFLLPEIWYMWHELWAPCALAMAPYGIAAFIFGRGDNPWPVNLLLIAWAIGVRAYSGSYGANIYFRRYGKFPDPTKF